MKIVIKSPMLILTATLVLTGCATPTTIFYNDGKVAHVVTCTGPNWATCLENAGNICQNAGYEIKEKNTGRGHYSLFSSGEEIKEMVVACKVKSEAVKPEADAAKPEAKPVVTEVKPNTVEVKPVGNGVKPEAAIVKPETAEVKSEATAVKSSAAAVKPEAAEAKPGKAKTKPSNADLWR